MGDNNLTAEELYQSLGPTPQSRRVKAEALFRRLRMDTTRSSGMTAIAGGRDESEDSLKSAQQKQRIRAAE